MPTYAYRCLPEYNCSCYSGKLVSRKTAMSHRAVEISRRKGSPFFLAVPNQVLTAEEPPFKKMRTLQIPSTISFTPQPDCTNVFPDAACTPSEVSLLQLLPSCDHEQHVYDDEIAEEIHNVSNPYENQGVFESAHAHPSTSRRLRGFRSRHSALVRLEIKHQHHTTEQFMDDLICNATRADPEKYRFKTFKCLREAIPRAAGMNTSYHPCCSLIHEALYVSCDGVTSSCS